LADADVADVVAAGTVLWRHTGGDLEIAPDVAPEIAVVHRPRYDDWSLPKGKLQAGESIWTAAVRETGEETGFSAVLGRYLGRVSYPTNRPVPGTKVVHYLAARAGAGEFVPNKEVDELRWLTPGDAAGLMSYPHDRDILTEFRRLPADLATVALVRHATAGPREQWSGPDELRPLNDRGWREVKALRGLLPLFGVNRIVCAPPLRCMQTMRPLADDLGVTIVTEPLMSEKAYKADRRAGVVRLLEIVTTGGTPVVCSQGGVIPDLLSRLAEASDLDLKHVDAGKGSVWVLSFSGGPLPLLVDADYIAEP